MSLNSTPSSDRIHIGFFGQRNAGKSSLVNAITDQELSVVSDTLGTTTDPVQKAMELLPLGPVLIIDTPGYDDMGELGEKRVKKTKQVLNRTDVAVLVVDATQGLTEDDNELLNIIKSREIPYIIAYNKSDEISSKSELKSNEIYVSAKTKENIHEIKELIGSLNGVENEKQLLGDLINKNDFVILVTPIDGSAPKGRMILPQQQAIRNVIDNNAVAIDVKETELEELLKNLGKKPSLVVTDSQAFGIVKKIVPEDIPLTSFSILMSRYKGYLTEAVKGVNALSRLQDGDTILMAEGCTHHRQCEDIGTYKLPKLIREYTGKELNFKTCSGTEFPEDFEGISLVINCGSCMLNEREVKYRMKTAVDAGVPFTNYGTVIAEINGILERSTCMLPEIKEL